MMSDNRLYKSLEEGFINNDTQYDFGGWAPPILFPRGIGFMEMRGGCGLGGKNISTLGFGLKLNGVLYEGSAINTQRMGFCFPLLQPQTGDIWDFEWVYPSGWYRCGNYWDEVVVIITDFITEDALGWYWGAVYYFYRDGVVYDTIVSSVEFRKTTLNNGCNYNVIFTAIGQNRTDNVVPSPTPSSTPSPTITPSITLSPTITPTITPSISISPTPSITPSPSVAGVEPEYQAVLDYATLQGYTLPTAPQQTLQNNLVKDLKIAGIWNDLDLLYVFATDGNNDFARINWTNPSSFYSTLNGGITFTTNEGFDASSNPCAYISTQYNWTTDSINFTQDDACRFYWDFDNNITGATNVGYDGVITTSAPSNRWNGINTFRHTINSTLFLPTSFDNSGTGLKMIQRTSNTDVNMYNGSSTPTSYSVSSTGMDNAVSTILRYGSGGANCSVNKCSIYGVGASLSGMETDLYNAINTYMSSI